MNQSQKRLNARGDLDNPFLVPTCLNLGAVIRPGSNLCHGDRSTSDLDKRHAEPPLMPSDLSSFCVLPPSIGLPLPPQHTDINYRTLEPYWPPTPVFFDPLMALNQSLPPPQGYPGPPLPGPHPNDSRLWAPNFLGTRSFGHLPFSPAGRQPRVSQQLLSLPSQFTSSPRAPLFQQPQEWQLQPKLDPVRLSPIILLDTLPIQPLRPILKHSMQPFILTRAPQQAPEIPEILLQKPIPLPADSLNSLREACKTATRIPKRQNESIAAAKIGKGNKRTKSLQFPAPVHSARSQSHHSPAKTHHEMGKDSVSVQSELLWAQVDVPLMGAKVPCLGPRFDINVEHHMAVVNSPISTNPVPVSPSEKELDLFSLFPRLYVHRRDMHPLSANYYTLRTNVANSVSLSFFGRKEEVMSIAKRNIHLHFSSSEFETASSLDATSTSEMHILFHLVDVLAAATYIPSGASIKDPHKLEFYEIPEVDAKTVVGVGNTRVDAIFKNGGTNESEDDTLAVPISGVSSEAHPTNIRNSWRCVPSTFSSLMANSGVDYFRSTGSSPAPKPTDSACLSPVPTNPVTPTSEEQEKTSTYEKRSSGADDDQSPFEPLFAAVFSFTGVPIHTSVANLRQERHAKVQAVIRAFNGSEVQTVPAMCLLPLDVQCGKNQRERACLESRRGHSLRQKVIGGHLSRKRPFRGTKPISEPNLGRLCDSVSSRSSHISSQDLHPTMSVPEDDPNLQEMIDLIDDDDSETTSDYNLDRKYQRPGRTLFEEDDQVRANAETDDELE